ncbi:type IV toxin-antitoxin system AbiEi family antitoxin domain-containing protein [Paraburkholderia tropica]|uniref:type IV toxin-antitoxin system AbiEi family antitoxin domain-containing protein n=1 Tax=Paraburkholderia tropica TaxID=92647 RepID=UPI002AB7E1CB|nr:hypothetical protein [Paraburkholderia tropica]
MEKQLSMVGALNLRLSTGHGLPTVSSYDIGLAAARIYASGEYGGQKIRNLQHKFPKRSDITRYKDQLLGAGVLQQDRHFPSDVWRMTGSPFDAPSDIICSLDPFCYVSHLSAMEYHGLTDRIPKVIFVTTPSLSEWKEFSIARMERDYGDLYNEFEQSDLPRIKNFSIKSIGKTVVNAHRSKTAVLGAFISPKDRPIRVSSIGRTFMDMLRNPDLCGGMTHVIDVFSNNVRPYVRLVVSEIDRNGSKIEKVRAGYILEEICGIKDNSTINSWIQFAQRGGSRKLDPAGDYWPRFSDRWSLSINIGREE